MKKSIACFRKNTVVLFPILCVQLLCAQTRVPEPSAWEEFTRGENNPAVRDTFLTQTFAGLPTDNWEYTTTGETAIEDISGVNDIPNKHGAYALRMPLGSTAAFTRFPLTHHDSVIITVHKGGARLVKGETMRVRTYRENEGTNYPSIGNPKDEDGIVDFDKTDITRNPPAVDILVAAPSKETKGGYYYVDSVYAHGMIPAYSLFSGSGDWDESTRWSHLPAYRHRHALIKGDTQVHGEIRCAELYLGEGSLSIAPDGRLSAQRLTLHADDPNGEAATSLISSGELNVRESVTVVRTFERKGRWYFVSFPFDVYASGIDPDFQLGDDSEETNGNYFYVQSYDGEKRARTQSLSDNWVVVPRSILQSDRPLFEKNKGYLLAIDEAADTRTLRFSSRNGEIPESFGREGEIDIQASVNKESGHPEHDGWYLCGNPLPAPLPLNRLTLDPALDGYVYLYDGTRYQSYAIGGDYAIPPFSAFFVKATKDIRMSVNSQSTSSAYKLLPTAGMTRAVSGPTISSRTPLSNGQNPPEEARFYLRGKTLYIENLPEEGRAEIFTLSGQSLITRKLSKGHDNLSLPLHQGIYLLNIQAGNLRTRQKLLIH